MSAGELLGRIVQLLDETGLKHMIAGSFASTYHGEPRTTQDIDIVVDGPPGFFISEAHDWHNLAVNIHHSATSARYRNLELGQAID